MVSGNVSTFVSGPVHIAESILKLNICTLLRWDLERIIFAAGFEDLRERRKKESKNAANIQVKQHPPRRVGRVICRVCVGINDPLAPLRMTRSDASYPKRYRLPLQPHRQATFWVSWVHNRVRGLCGCTARPGHARSDRTLGKCMAYQTSRAEPKVWVMVREVWLRMKKKEQKDKSKFTHRSLRCRLLTCCLAFDFGAWCPQTFWAAEESGVP